MSNRAWTLLLMGEENGIVGGPERTFEKHPAHYERVTVIERDPALARIAELKAENARLREALNDIGHETDDNEIVRIIVEALLGGGE